MHFSATLNYKRFTKGPYSNFTNFTTQIKVNNRYNIKKIKLIIFIESYKFIDILEVAHTFILIFV